MGQKYSYEDKSDVIDLILKKRSKKWHLYAVAWLDYNDVSQIIRAHIHKKWSQWDQSLPIEPWLNRIVTRQIFNQLRNNYSSFAKPCISCKHSLTQGSGGGSENTCGITKSGIQDSDCSKYAKWERTKKHAYNVKLPVSLSHHAHHSSTSQSDHLNMDQAADRLHSEMKKVLSGKHYFIYKMLFIDGLKDGEVAIILGYKSSEKGRSNGYKQIKNLKNEYKKIAENIAEKKELFF